MEETPVDLPEVKLGAGEAGRSALPEKPSRLSPGALAVATSGNVLEWYDFTVYGFLAPTLARVFFPSGDPSASLLSAFGVLAVGYIARPIGSVIFGHIGDRIGRRPALIASIFLMGAGSVSIGLLPGYEQVGLSAPVALVLIRVVQGISVAGEYTAAGVLIVEGAPKRSRAFVGSWLAFAMLIGCVLGSAIPASIASFTSQEQLLAWGWRVPFLLGAVIAVVGGVLRKRLAESSSMAPVSARERSPVITALRDHWGKIAQMIALLLPTAVIYFLIFVYAASYLVDEMHFSAAQALDITTANLLVIAVSALLVGRCADRYGARAVLLWGAFATLLFGWPLWWLMHRDSLALVFAGQFGFSVLNAIGWGLSITVLTEMAPPGLRCSVVALGYNLCMAIFGGTTPMVATYLVARSGDDFAPVYYVLMATLLSIPAILALPIRTAAAPGEVV
ncbi:MAG: MFS transporter [Roseibacillus sp.]|nr:MFS transporter [Roseibacillus sp.]